MQFSRRVRRLVGSGSGMSKVRRRTPRAFGNTAACERLEDRVLLSALPAGSLDPTFGTGGVVTTDFLGETDDSFADFSLVQPDGKIIVAATTVNSLGARDIALTRFHTNGTLDTTFGDAGKAVLDFGALDTARALTLDASGRIIVAGSTATDLSFQSDFAVARFHSDGTLDTSFGIGGFVISELPGGFNSASDVEIDSSGRIVVAGTVGNTPTTDDNVAVLRFLETGALDNTFGGDGIVTTDVRPYTDSDFASALEIDASGNIVVVASSDLDFALLKYDSGGNLVDKSIANIGQFATTDRVSDLTIDSHGRAVAVGVSNNELAVARFRADGSLDTTFAGDGTFTTDFFGDGSAGGAVAIDVNGNIVVAGRSISRGPTFRDFGLVRLTAQGALDTTFNGTGKVTIDFGGGDSAGSLAFDATGRIIVGGSHHGSAAGDLALVRLNADGTIDGTFGSDGKVIADLLGSANDVGRDIVVQADGKVIVAGTTDVGPNGNDFALSRYNRDGTLDLSFGTNGRVITDFDGNTEPNQEHAESVTLDASGRILIAGHTGFDIAVARYNPDGSLDTSFGIDGRLILDLGGSDFAEAIAVDANGNILIGGHSNEGSTGFDFALARLDESGDPDTSFGGGDGIVFTDFGGTTDFFADLTITDAGRIVAVGNADQGSSATRDFAVAVYNADGGLDATFSGDGRTTIDLGGSLDAAEAVAVDADGRVIIGGSSSQENTFRDIALVRYTATGMLDTTFGGDGIVLTDFGASDFGASDFLHDLHIDLAGGIVGVGYTQPISSDESDRDVALVRYTADGTLDAAFGTNGKTITDLADGDDVGSGVALDAEGRILVAGNSQQPTTGQDFVLLRFGRSDVNNPPLANDDSYIVDEDGTLVVDGGADGGQPVLRYGFDESAADSADAIDSGINPATNGTFVDQATRTGNTPDSASLGALDLTTSSNDYVTAGDVDELDALTELTITLWVNLQADPSDGDRLLSDRPTDIGSAGATGWALGITSNFDDQTISASRFALMFSVYESSGTVGTSEFQITNGFNAEDKWTFVAVTYDRTIQNGEDGGLVRYWNGNGDTAVTQQGFASFYTNLLGGPNDGDLRIGGRADAPTTDLTPPAWLDDVRIYDHPLTQQELEAVRQEGLTQIISGVLANDTDSDGDPLTAVLVTEPQHGSVQFNTDGTFTYTPDANYHGPDSFTYKANDGLLDSNVATVSISVSPINDAPLAIGGTATTDEDTAVIINVLANDSDIDGDTLSVASVTNPFGGSAAISDNGTTITFTPDENFNGTTRFQYTISDGNGGTDSAIVRLDVNSVNDAPILAVSNELTVPEGASATITRNVLQVTDVDNSADEITLKVTRLPLHGTLLLDGTALAIGDTLTQADINAGKLSYQHDGGDTTRDVILFDFSDDGQTYTGGIDFVVNVDPVNDRPILAVNEGITVIRGETVTIDEAALEVADVDDPPEQVTLVVTRVEDGTLRLAGTVLNVGDSLTQADINAGRLSYQHDGIGPRHPVILFDYSDGQSPPRGIDFVVNVVLDPDPIARDDTFIVGEDRSRPVFVLNNDGDRQGGPLTITSVSDPLHGTATINNNGRIIYRSDENYNGPDSFTYTISDPQGNTDTATVSMDVRPINDAPIVAVNEQFPVPEGGFATVTEEFLQVTDVDNPPGEVTFEINGFANHIKLRLDGTALSVGDTFTQADINAGRVSIQHDGSGPLFQGAGFYVSDGQSQREHLVLHVKVTPTNDPPQAGDDELPIGEDRTRILPVRRNDSDAEGDPLTIVSVSDPLHGTATINPNGRIVYTSDDDYNGPDSFTYTISDGNGGIDTATVSMDVRPVNDRPTVAVKRGLTVPEGSSVTITAGHLQVTDVDDSAEEIVFVVAGLPGSGTLLLEGTALGVGDSLTQADINAGRVSYEHDGSDTSGGFIGLDYSDGEASPRRLGLLVTVNDTPVARPRPLFLNEDESRSGFLFGIDPESQELTYALASDAAHGDVVVNADGSFTYTPDANFNGSDSFTFTVSDGSTTSEPATVSITVDPVDDPAVINGDSVVTDEDTPVVIDVLANDFDVDGDPLSVIFVNGEPGGTAAITDGGTTITFTPDANFHGTVVIGYAISDGVGGGSSVAPVSITVSPINDAPIIDNQAFSIAENSPVGTVVGTVTASDPDAGDALSFAITGGNTAGTFAIDSASGEITVADAALLDFETTPNFTLTIKADDGSLSKTAQVTIALTNVDETAPRDVRIDIRPRRENNRININSHGKIRVAILSSAEFDAVAEVNVDSLRFGRTGQEQSLWRRGNGEPRVKIRDVNGDDRPDLIVSFEVEDTGFQDGDDTGILTGETEDGQSFTARDAVRIISPGHENSDEDRDDERDEDRDDEWDDDRDWRWGDEEEDDDKGEEDEEENDEWWERGSDEDNDNWRRDEDERDGDWGRGSDSEGDDWEERLEDFFATYSNWNWQDPSAVWS